MRRILLVGLVAGALAAPPAGAAARTLAIASFDSVVDVDAGGGMRVSETIRARFTGEWNGLYRTIPVAYRTTDGFGFHLRLRVLGATDRDGLPLRYEVSREGGDVKLKVWVPQARDATRIVVLHYAVDNGLRFFTDHDELYWNVTGNAWDAPIEQASLRVNLPPGARGLRATGYAGPSGSRRQDVAVETRGTVEVRTRHPLARHEGLTAVVGWQKGLVREPSRLARAAGVVQDNWPLAVPLVLLPLMWGVWYAYGRDPRRAPIVVRYEPPAGMTPAEAGALLANASAMRDVTATLVDLAVRGFIAIEAPDNGNYVFHLECDPTEWTELATHERKLLAAMFADGARPRSDLQALKGSFHVDLPAIREDIFAGLMRRGYYRTKPSVVLTSWLVAGCAVGLLLACGALEPTFTIAAGPLAFVVAGVLSALVIAGFALVMPARTVAGTRALAGVLGFKEFLERVEGDRLERVVKTPALFEKFLPFAMALGVEERWTAAFRDVLRNPPDWYRTTDGADWSPARFDGSLHRMSADVGSALAYTPPSTGGSGFGGGGSSGGGGGGGGGGGF